MKEKKHVSFDVVKGTLPKKKESTLRMGKASKSCS